MARSCTLCSTICFAVLWCANAQAEVSEHKLDIENPVAQGTFRTLNEPSGITALDKNTLLVIEDESSAALRRLHLTNDSIESFSFTEHSQSTGTNFIQRRLIGPLDDLEGIARVSANRFFVIGSHENASRGRLPLREKLMMFTRSDSDITHARMRQDLYEQLEIHLPQLTNITQDSKSRSAKRLNIEGLAFDRKRDRLLIGLRTPTIDKQAIVVTLNNAIEFLEGKEPDFGNDLHLIDLDKQGIRAMAYDDLSDQLLVVGRRETGKKRHFSLWTLNASSLSEPVRFNSDSKKLFENVEGVTPINNGVLFVRDGGDTLKKSDKQWFILSRKQLGLR